MFLSLGLTEAMEMWLRIELLKLSIQGRRSQLVLNNRARRATREYERLLCIALCILMNCGRDSINTTCSPSLLLSGGDARSWEMRLCSSCVLIPLCCPAAGAGSSVEENYFSSGNEGAFVGAEPGLKAPNSSEIPVAFGWRTGAVTGEGCKTPSRRLCPQVLQGNIPSGKREECGCKVHGFASPFGP